MFKGLVPNSNIGSAASMFVILIKRKLTFILYILEIVYDIIYHDTDNIIILPSPDISQIIFETHSKLVVRVNNVKKKVI